MKREIISNNCFGMIDGKITQLPIGHIIETDDENCYGAKARTIVEKKLTLEVATPKPKKKTKQKPIVEGE